MSAAMPSCTQFFQMSLLMASTLTLYKRRPCALRVPYSGFLALATLWQWCVVCSSVVFPTRMSGT